MTSATRRIGRTLTILAILICSPGCETSKQRQLHATQPSSPLQRLPEARTLRSSDLEAVQLISHVQDQESSQSLPPSPASPIETVAITSAPPAGETLAELEAMAVASNPALRRLQQEAAAEWAKTRYVGALPDPGVSSMFFLPPMNFEPDRQVAELQFTQMIPWLSRLKAESQRAHMEALAADNMYHAERLRVVGDLRATWFKLYILSKQIETTEADKSQLESLIKTANARVATGDAQPGDVLMASLELSSLQEQLLSYRQQIVAVTAELNRLVGRDSHAPIAPPATIAPELPQSNHAQLLQLAMESQPELTAARMRTAASRWGIEVARLKRRPDPTFGLGWVVMDAPTSTTPGDGDDSFTLGVSTNLPLWHGKYDAMTAEASREHAAAHASEDDVVLRLDALLRDLWEQAETSQQTIALYQTSILPLARQTFEANQKSLVNNSVTFDRVIRDYRTLLNLELGYHRALGQLATTIARIQQTTGVELVGHPTTNPADPETIRD